MRGAFFATNLHFVFLTCGGAPLLALAAEDHVCLLVHTDLSCSSTCPALLGAALRGPQSRLSYWLSQRGEKRTCFFTLCMLGQRKRLQSKGDHSESRAQDYPHRPTHWTPNTRATGDTHHLTPTNRRSFRASWT